MPVYSPKYGNNKSPNNHFGEFVLMLFIALNGLSVGGAIRTGRDMIVNGTDSDSIIALLLYLGCTIYTAQRAIEIYKKIHKDNDKQR